MSRSLISVSLLVAVLMAGCSVGSASPAPEAAPAPSTPKQAPAPAGRPSAPTQQRRQIQVELPAEGTTVLAVDPTGEAGPEQVAVSDRLLRLAGTSPDGRYMLFLGRKTAPTVTTHLLDRSTGQWQQGPAVPPQPQAVVWSGRGFWVDWLVHLGLDLQVDRYPALREALGVSGGSRQVVAASFTADGKKVAALVGPAGLKPEAAFSLDLYVGDAEGRKLTRVEKVVQPWFAQGEPVAFLAMAPDGSRLVIGAASPQVPMIHLGNDPTRENWKLLGKERTLQGPLDPSQVTQPWPAAPRWSADSRQVWIPSRQWAYIYDRSGVYTGSMDGWPEAFFWEPGSLAHALWDPDLGGQSRALVKDSSFAVLADLPLPGHAILVGFLADGRVLISNR